jgi:hypothetical protein
MRRVFLQVDEIPGLFAGVLRGEPVAMRRILGARRAGRVGALLGALGALAWLGEPALAGLCLGQLAIALPGAALSRPPLTWLEYQRLSLWLAGAALLAAAPLRAAPALAPHGVWLIWLAAHLWLWRGLRAGLDDR